MNRFFNLLKTKSDFVTGIILGIILLTGIGAATYKTLIGPTSATTSNAIALWTDNSSYKLKNSVVTIDDGGQITVNGTNLYYLVKDISGNVVLINSSDPFYLAGDLNVGPTNIINELSSKTSANMTNNGASVIGMFPMYTDTTGTQVTPTNSFSAVEVEEIQLISLTETNKLTGLGANTNIVVATAAMVTNTLGTFDNSTNSVLSGAGTMRTVGVPTSYTVSTLPASAVVGQQVYCSDMLTPWGTGGIVQWDGTTWRDPRTGVYATTTMANYIFDCATNSITRYTPLSDIDISTLYGTAGPAYEKGFSKGAGLTLDTGISTSGIFARITSGASANTYTMASGYAVPIATAGHTYACGGQLTVYAQCDGTDTYFAWYGFSASFSATNLPPQNFIGFLYDRWNLAGRSSPGSSTNNWICLTSKAGSTTYTDSGLAVTASMDPTTWDRLSIIWTTTGAVFYTNGVQCASHDTTTLPTSGQYYANEIAIVKHAGTNVRYLHLLHPWFHHRWASNRTF